MSRPSRPSQGHGFTVVELLIIVVIIALIAVMIVPIFLRTLETGKQKRTMSDMNLVGKAMMAWVADQLGAAAAGAPVVPIQDYGQPIAIGDLENLLVPRYLPRVPEFDSWGGSLDYRLNLASLSNPKLMAIRSGGQDRVFSTDTYDEGPFDPRAYSEDLVWVDGVFVRWPEKE